MTEFLAESTDASFGILRRAIEAQGCKVVINTAYAPSYTRGIIKLDSKDYGALFHEWAHFMLSERLGMPKKSEVLEGLDGIALSIFKLESELSYSTKNMMHDVFGKPEFYEAVLKWERNFYSGHVPSDIIRGGSYIGNLSDESSTLGKREMDGHAMDGFHEFFASAVHTMAFGDMDASLKNLGLFRKVGAAIAEDGDVGRIREIQSKTTGLLKAVHIYGTKLVADLSHGENSLKEIANLKRNLAILGDYLQAEGNRNPAEAGMRQRKLVR